MFNMPSKPTRLGTLTLEYVQIWETTLKATVRVVQSDGSQKTLAIDASGPQSPTFYWDHGLCPIARAVFTMAEAKLAETVLKPR